VKEQNKYVTVEDTAISFLHDKQWYTFVMENRG